MFAPLCSPTVFPFYGLRETDKCWDSIFLSGRCELMEERFLISDTLSHIIFLINP